MNQLTPTPRLDKNGRLVTRHMRDTIRSISRANAIAPRVDLNSRTRGLRSGDIINLWIEKEFAFGIHKWIEDYITEPERDESTLDLDDWDVDGCVDFIIKELDMHSQFGQLSDSTTMRDHFCIHEPVDDEDFEADGLYDDLKEGYYKNVVVEARKHVKEDRGASSLASDGWL